ncbi:MAG TPA: phosphoribosylformylglycinamidine synthase subunit PurS [Euzebya sp.]|nr:phosphoribosylformylglycinamidine synthase subunit PurS [Euzebya sp.]
MTRVVVDVMLKPEILDPQGQAVERALPSLGLEGVRSVRIGKRIEVEVDDDVSDARALVEVVADKLLANLVIEAYTVTVVPDGAAVDG